MKLTDEQKEIVARWADEDEINFGVVQKRLKSEFGIAVTYLETRFLLEDHAIELKPAARPAEEPEQADALDEVEAILADDGDSRAPGGTWEQRQGPGPGGGKVSVSLDSITAPQAMASGGVTFPDGQTAQWSVDQMGRLALDPATPGYRPSEADIMAFQVELQRVMGAT